MKRKIDPATMHPRYQITEVIHSIYTRGMTTTSGGNISIIDNYGDVWITPSAIDKGSLTPDDIVCVKPDGSVIGRHEPSSELPFHKAIYKIRPDIKAVIHAHPSGLVSFSIVNQIPETAISGLMAAVCRRIAYAEYGLPGSEELSVKIASKFSEGAMSVIMENHGIVLGGANMVDAYQRFEALEFCARAIINAHIIGKPNFLSSIQLQQHNDGHTPEIPESEMPDDTTAIETLRHEMCNIVHRGCRQGLFFGALGTVSLRLDDDDFLITPENAARWNLLPVDMVRVKDGCCARGLQPDSSAWLHREIFFKNPDTRVIINAQPPNLMAFAVTHRQLDVRTIPESWIFLRDVPSLPFGSQLYPASEIVDVLSDKIPALLVQNDSFIVTGKKLIQAFDRLEVAEFSAQSLIMAESIGKLIPIGNGQIEDLRRTFT